MNVLGVFLYMSYHINFVQEGIAITLFVFQSEHPPVDPVVPTQSEATST